MGFSATIPPTLVMGATGRIGRLLRHCWSDEIGANADLRWQARACPGDRRQGESWHILAPLDASAALAQAARGVDVILCLAGVTPGHGGDMADNIRLGEAAVRAAAATGARVLLTSSAAVYGAQGGCLDESAPLQPVSPYGAAKAEMERRCAGLGRELGVEVCALRIGNIAGLDAILGGWRPGFQLDRFAGGRTPRRSYIGPATLADVLKALLCTPDLPTCLNVAQPGLIEMGDLLRAAGRAFTLRPAPEAAIPEVALDVSRLSALLPPETALEVAEPARLVAEWAALEEEAV